MKTIRLFTVLFSLVLLASCSNDSDELPPSIQDDGQIKFEIGIAGKSYSRFVDHEDFESGAEWETGDKIGLFAVKHASDNPATLQSWNNYIHNVKLTRQSDGSWKTDPGTEMYYPNDNEVLDFYAYYPYDDNNGSPELVNPTAQKFSVQIDQRLNVDFSKSHFLWAKQENVSKSENAVSLQFSYTMALIQVKIIEYYNLSTLPDIYQLEVPTDCTINLSNQNISAEGTKNKIIMRDIETNESSSQTDGIFWALVPPQTIDIRFAWNYNNNSYSVTPATNVNLTSGRVEKYEITIQ